MAPGKIFLPTSPSSASSGQSSVEAALLLPILLALIVLLVQPVCLLYTRSLMASAAAETLRVATTATDSSSQELEAFVKRRLAAVPSVDIFHTGGAEDWDIHIEGAGSSQVSIRIEGHAKALPMLEPISRISGLSDDKGLKLSVHLSTQTRPSWLEGSYEQWQSLWH